MYELKPLLTTYAYNILGTVEDASDVVQDAFVKYHQVNKETVRDEKAYLVRTVINLAINAKRKMKKRAADYPGEWLPEPVETNLFESAVHTKEILSYSLMVLLENLNAKQRAVFILKEAFDYDHEEIADVLEISADNSRQLLTRARKQLEKKNASSPYHKSTSRDGNIRDKIPPGKDPLTKDRFEESSRDKTAVANGRFDENNRDKTAVTNGLFGENSRDKSAVDKNLLDKYLEVFRVGDISRLEELLNEDIALVSDGGGKAAAFVKPILGSAAVAALLAGISKKFYGETRIEKTEVNNQPALLYYQDGKIVTCQILLFENGMVKETFFMRNPDKLAGIVKNHQAGSA